MKNLKATTKAEKNREMKVGKQTQKNVKER
jgi:hypothetical protein